MITALRTPFTNDWLKGSPFFALQIWPNLIATGIPLRARYNQYLTRVYVTTTKKSRDWLILDIMRRARTKVSLGDILILSSTLSLALSIFRSSMCVSKIHASLFFIKLDQICMSWHSLAHNHTIKKRPLRVLKCKIYQIKVFACA